MFDSVARAGAAVVTGCPTAVFQAQFIEGVAPVLPQEVLVQPCREVVPRKHLVLGAVTVDVPVDIAAVDCHGLEPEVVVEVLRPLLERAAPAPDILDHRTQAAVPTTGDALCEGCLGIVPFELHAPGPSQIIAQQPDLARQLSHSVLAEPLERRERLGHETAHRHRHRR